VIKTTKVNIIFSGLTSCILVREAPPKDFLFIKHPCVTLPKKRVNEFTLFVFIYNTESYFLFLSQVLVPAPVPVPAPPWPCPPPVPEPLLPVFWLGLFVLVLVRDVSVPVLPVPVPAPAPVPVPVLVGFILISFQQLVTDLCNPWIKALKPSFARCDVFYDYNSKIKELEKFFSTLNELQLLQIRCRV
jgi:hypothetical protein